MLVPISHSGVSMLLTLASLLLGCAEALPASYSLLPPSGDPFYSAPRGFESAAPGTVLRSRIVPGNLTTVNFNNASKAYNILFRTTDARYRPSWAFTTLFVPKMAKNDTLLSYQIPYDSANVDAGPTTMLYAPTAALGLIQSDIQTALSQGWYVNVPDHEGPLASFGLGVQEGHATLDSVRASLNGKYGLTQEARYAMWGYSGGSLASEWAAELQVQYAPELNFAGTALGGLPSNASEIFPAISKTIWAGLAPQLLLGVTTQYPEARSYLLSQLKSEGQYNKSGFLGAECMSTAEAFTFYGNQSIYAYFKNGKEFFDATVIQEIFDEQGYMGYHGVPRMPLFIYKAVADEITSIESTDELVQRFCGVGANIVFERNAIGGHLAEETNGDKSALEWLTKVLAGNYQHEGCTITNVSISLDTSPLR